MGTLGVASGPEGYTRCGARLHAIEGFWLVMSFTIRAKRYTTVLGEIQGLADDDLARRIN